MPSGRHVVELFRHDNQALNMKLSCTTVAGFQTGSRPSFLLMYVSVIYMPEKIVIIVLRQAVFRNWKMIQFAVNTVKYL